MDRIATGSTHMVTPANLDAGGEPRWAALAVVAWMHHVATTPLQELNDPLAQELHAALPTDALPPPWSRRCSECGASSTAPWPPTTPSRGCSQTGTALLKPTGRTAWKSWRAPAPSSPRPGRRCSVRRSAVPRQPRRDPVPAGPHARHRHSRPSRRGNGRRDHGGTGARIDRDEVLPGRTSRWTRLPGGSWLTPCTASSFRTGSRLRGSPREVRPCPKILGVPCKLRESGKHR